jgi:small-conductance mechanosensitive channel
MKNLNIENAYELIATKIEQWIETLITMLPNLVIAVLVLIAFFLLAKGTRKLAQHLIGKFSENEALTRILSTILFVAVVGVGLFTALSVLKLDKALTSLLAGAGIVGLALSFAFQDSATNFISGIFMAMRKPFKLGDMIETADVSGIVDQMNLRNTVLLSFQGQYVYIPNKEVYQNKLVNYTNYGKRRIDLEIGVSYGDNLAKAQEVAIEAINQLDFVIEQEKTAFVFHTFGNSSINGKLMYWIKFDDNPGFLTAQSEGVKAVKKAFDENNITIPFPIRTLDFDIKGGAKLSSQLQAT